MKQLTQVIAAKLIEKAEEKATKIGVRVCIAITDGGAHLLAFKRMDGAFTGSVDVAIGKARTSSLFPLPSGDFGDLIRNEQLTGMELSNHGLVGFPGGHPIKANDDQIGAIGISGASAGQDAEIAAHAVLEVSQWLR